MDERTGQPRKLVITRTFDAPRELVWDAWTRREHLLHWFCPKDFSVLFVESDPRPGGAWRSGMRAPDGSEYIAHGEYHQIDPPHRLTFTHQWEKNHLEPPADTLVTVTLAERDGGTQMTFEQTGFASAASRDSHEGGWTEAFDNLGRRIDASRPATDAEILITRVFDAPRPLAWEAWTQAEHLPQWWGPRDFSTRVEEHEFRPGGAFRYVMIGPDSKEYPAQGVFREIVPLRRIVASDEFPEDFELPGHPDLPAGIVQTILFEDIDDKTRITVRIAHASEADRRKHEAMGVVEGYGSMLDCLADHLAAVDSTTHASRARITSDFAVPDAPAGTADREMVIRRVIDAPRERVWDAFTDPAHIGRWWGPDGFTTTTHHMDFRPGGAWRFDMHGPDGRDYPNRVVYNEIVKPGRLVYSHTDAGDVEPVCFTHTLTLEPHGDDARQTLITMRMVFPSAEHRDEVARKYGAVEGAIQTLGRLADHLTDGRHRAMLTLALPSEHEIIMARTFDAPRERVFDALTNPEVVRHWLHGPAGWSLAHCQIDAQPGGTIRYVWRHAEQGDMGMRGRFREVTPPERTVHTELFDEDWTDGETVVTTTFAWPLDRTDRTTVTTTVRYNSVHARDMALRVGMADGVAQSYDRLADHLAAAATP